jgi:hypothetical protein
LFIEGSGFMPSTPVFAVIGPENLENMELAKMLRHISGEDNVFRGLTIADMFTFAEQARDGVGSIFVDLFGYNPIQMTEAIGQIREKYPVFVFTLYIDKEVFIRRASELPREWGTRFQHYYKLYKQPKDVEFEPLVRMAIASSQEESRWNYKSLPKKPTAPPHSASDKKPETSPMIFISYSRRDWDSFVSGLVDQVGKAGFQVWIDQNLLVGGDDWMDKIGEALEKCKMLLLVMSPDALSSRYVKMEYRYFFNMDKLILPVLYRPLEKIPPELMLTQYIDFTQPDRHESAYKQLFQVVRQHMTEK